MVRYNLKNKEAILFEQFALELLRAEAKKQNKVLLIGNELKKEYSVADALAPSGIYDLPGPTLIEIKIRPSNRIKDFFSFVVGKGLEFSSVLLVFKEAKEVSKYKDEINKIFPLLHIKTLVSKDIEELASLHPDAALPFQNKFLKQAINYYQTRGEEDYFQQIQALRTAYNEDRLVLFLGAGVSASAGFPNWNELLKRVSTELFQDYSVGGVDGSHKEEIFAYFQSEAPSSPIIMARLLRDSFQEKFGDKVRSSLYHNTTPQSSSPLLKEVGALCMPGRHRIGLPAVVTYNFDDLLEIELERREIPYCSIVSDQDEPLPNQLPIYHVHGFLPRKGALSPKHQASLVLSEEAYHNQFTDPYLWSNITSLNLLRNKVCLFVGLSLTDPNLRRLLEITISKKPDVRHYAILIDHWHVNKNIPESIRSLPEVFKGLEEASLAKLGISAIWVRKHEKVPDFLAQIKVGI